MKLSLALALFFASFSAQAMPQLLPVVSEDNPFAGSRFYRPTEARQAKRTSIVMLHGSEGGSNFSVDREANLLASLGYDVLVYCYFDCGRALTGPREMLKNVEASKALEAIAWLRKQPTSNGNVVVYGFSRGAELTLILGALPSNGLNKPTALIAHAGSDTFNGPMSWDWFEPACWLCRRGPGQCSNRSQNTDFEWNASCGEDKNPALIDFSVSAWTVYGQSVRAGDRIAVEKFAGAVLLTAGLQDEVWPAEQTKRVERTLRSAGTKVQAQYYPAGGHNLKGADESNRRQLVLDFLDRL